MLQEYLAGLDDLFAVGFVGEEFTLETFDLFFTNHAFQAVEQEHLALRVYEDILVGIGKAVVQEGLEDEPGAAAEGKGLGKGIGMSEFQELFTGGAFVFAGTCELGQVHSQEAKAECVDGVDAFGAAGGGVCAWFAAE